MAAQALVPSGERCHAQVVAPETPSGSVSVAVRGVSTRGCVDDRATVPAALDAGVESKTQGRACLIARMLALVILNSISMANGSSAAGLYCPLKWL